MKRGQRGQLKIEGGFSVSVIFSPPPFPLEVKRLLFVSISISAELASTDVLEVPGGDSVASPVQAKSSLPVIMSSNAGREQLGD